MGLDEILKGTHCCCSGKGLAQVALSVEELEAGLVLHQLLEAPLQKTQAYGVFCHRFPV